MIAKIRAGLVMLLTLGRGWPKVWTIRMYVAILRRLPTREQQLDSLGVSIFLFGMLLLWSLAATFGVGCGS